jgi:hypothetical protein
MWNKMQSSTDAGSVCTEWQQDRYAEAVAVTGIVKTSDTDNKENVKEKFKREHVQKVTKVAKGGGKISFQQ